jgi:hypothetical protein
MKIVIAIGILLTVITIFDTMTVVLLQMWHYPLNISAMGYYIPQNDLIWILLILYPLAIIEWVFVMWYIEREKKWNERYRQ